MNVIRPYCKSNRFKQQTITWANVDPDPYHHMASLGHNGLGGGGGGGGGERVYFFSEGGRLLRLPGTRWLLKSMGSEKGGFKVDAWAKKVV